LTAFPQSKETKKADNAEESFKQFEEFNLRSDTLQLFADSIMEKWEKKLELMKQEQYWEEKKNKPKQP